MLHRVDLGEICRDIMVAAAFARGQMEATARKRWRRCTAEMDHRGERLFLLLVGDRVWPARKNRRDVAVQKHRCELDGVARQDPSIDRQ